MECLRDGARALGSTLSTVCLSVLPADSGLFGSCLSLFGSYAASHVEYARFHLFCAFEGRSAESAAPRIESSSSASVRHTVSFSALVHVAWCTTSSTKLAYAADEMPSVLTADECTHTHGS